MKHLRIIGLAAGFALLSAGAAVAQTKSTLEVVKARGMVKLRVGPGTPGFSNPDDKGNWAGFDVRHLSCRGGRRAE